MLFRNPQIPGNQPTADVTKLCACCWFRKAAAPAHAHTRIPPSQACSTPSGKTGAALPAATPHHGACEEREFSDCASNSGMRLMAASNQPQHQPGTSSTRNPCNATHTQASRAETPTCPDARRSSPSINRGTSCWEQSLSCWCTYTHTHTTPAGMPHHARKHTLAY